jgi:hypothetical protein
VRVTQEVAIVLPIIVALISALAGIIVAMINQGWKPFPPPSSPPHIIPDPRNSPFPQPPIPIPPSGRPGSVDATPPPTIGNWTNRVGDLKLTVTKVEVIGKTGSGKWLRFHLTVNNETTDAIGLPLNCFSAIASGGTSYSADIFASRWPTSVPAQKTVRGSVDLSEGVPESVHTVSVSFTQIFGSLSLVGKGITVDEIDVP